MRIKWIPAVLAVSLLLSGCSWMDGSYVSVTPHQEQNSMIRTENLTVSNYDELVAAMEEIVAKGSESSIINVVHFEQEDLQTSIESAVRHIQKVYPIGAFAVDSLAYDVGTNSGKTAIALDISYLHSRTEIRKIQTVSNLEEAKSSIGKALRSYDSVLVLEIEEYEQANFHQLVEDYAMENPQDVMEVPQVTAEIYGIGHSRVVELTFSYQTSRDALRTMQTQVQPVFDSAELYVSGEGTDTQKYAQLYAFLMERFDYKLETSITPTYSLLRHGVGDSRAFATVFAAMCRDAGLECLIVTGTCAGEPRIWNIIRDGDVYYHLDLLSCSKQGQFLRAADQEMIGYVWDYSAYPACDSPAYVEVPVTEENNLEEP